MVISARTFRIRTSRRGLLAAAACIVAAALLAVPVEQAVSAHQPGAEVMVGRLAAGRMLVSSRNLGDPNFVQSVVLLVEYGRGGAAGLVLTDRSEVALSSSIPGVDPSRVLGARAFIGGPVSPETVLALSRTGCDGCRQVTRSVYLVNTPDALQERLSAGADERTLRVYLGYSGWGPAQLDAEVRDGAWRVIDGDAAAVFDRQPDTLWRRMLARAESALAGMLDDLPRPTG